MVIWRIWSFWEELEAKENVCHNFRRMLVNKQPFSPFNTEKCKSG